MTLLTSIQLKFIVQEETAPPAEPEEMEVPVAEEPVEGLDLC